MSKINWNEQNTATLTGLVVEGEVVTQERVSEIAEEMGTTPRSIGSKLRRLGYEVEKATARPSKWTEEQEAALRQFVEANAGQFTYKEIAAQFMNGEFNDKQIQGKILNLELYDQVRKAEKVSAPRTYTPEEEARFVELANSGASMEKLSEAFGKTLSSVRGKALSLLRSGQIEAMPAQEVSNAKTVSDPVSDLGDSIATMTVAQIAEATGKSERGIKSTLSRRGITCADYDGAARREKLDAKASAE